MKIQKVCVMFALVFFLSPDLYAQTSQVPVQLSIPHITAQPGATIEVPINISDITGLNITATDLLIHYDARIVTAVRPIISRTFTNRWSEAFRVGFVEGSQDTLGLIDIALATSNRIPEGSGVFLNVRFTVSDSAQEGQVSPLIFVEAILNNRNPQTTTQDGSITVKTGSTLIGDFTGDCKVDFQDFLALAPHFGSQQGDDRYDPIFDLNSDGKINFSDFILFVQHFGETCA